MSLCDYFLKCRECGEEIPYKIDCQCQLGEHLIEKHEKCCVGHFSFGEGLVRPCKSSIRGDKVRKAKPNTVYKTTVETWASGPVKIKCTSCGFFGSPNIRRQRNKIAYTSLGALCLLGCWPLCFLPFLSSGLRVHLFCKSCGSYLGEYNKKTGVFMHAKSQERFQQQCNCS